MKSLRNKSNKRNGGAATVMPLSYYNPGAAEPAVDAGRDLLKAIPPLGIRPKIGGKRRSKHRTRRHRTRRHHKSKGGFMPSVMDGFIAAASKYAVPVALFAGYKLMTRKQKKGRQTRRR
jgi:hypothetical protein